MKNITISTENSETYSSISNFFIDYYMTEANGEFVKVYLYLVRLLSRGTAFTVAEIADHFNLTENDICRAIKYWISKEAVKLNYDGAGNLSGIVLLPLKMPNSGLKVSTDAISILRSEEYKPEKKAVRIESKISKDRTDTDVEFSVPAKTELTPAGVAKLQKDENWEDIVYQLETLFAKPMSQKDLSSLAFVYTNLHFDVELIEYLIEYCVMRGKKNCRYLEATAIAWYQDGINTKAKAKAQCNELSVLIRKVFNSLCIDRVRPTDTEQAFVKSWSTDMGFSDDIIVLACDKAIATRPNSATFKYVNGILENWSRHNVTTIEDVQRLDASFAAQKEAEAKQKKSGNITSINDYNKNEKTTGDDKYDELEKLFLKEVNQK